ncbi:MAG: hypothetical protein RR942_05745 [Romboutsia sp.]
MKKIFALLVSTILLLVGCTNSNMKSTDNSKTEQSQVNVNENLEVPPFGTANGIKMDLVSYTWRVVGTDGKTTTETKDTPDINDYLSKHNKNYQTSQVGEIALEFSSKPKSVKVSVVAPENKELEVKNNSIINVPTEKGITNFKVEAEFEQGTAIYAFSFTIA